MRYIKQKREKSSESQTPSTTTNLLKNNMNAYLAGSMRARSMNLCGNKKGEKKRTERERKKKKWRKIF